MKLSDLFLAQTDQKAIPAHPALLAYNDNPLPIGARVKKTPIGQREAKRHLQAYGGGDAIDWVMDCVRLISETASNADYHFEKDTAHLSPGKKPGDPTEIEEAPLLLRNLLAEPNPYMDYLEFIELLVIDLLLVGNAYWLKWRQNDEGQPLALYRLAPPYVSLVPGEFGVEGYHYKVAGHEEPLKLGTKDVIHFKLPNPHDPYLGLGVVQGGARPLDLELSLTDTQASYYENHAQPSLVVQSDRRVPDDVFSKLKNQLRAMYSGPRNSGEMMVLEAGLKAQSIAPNAAEAAFEPLTKLSRDRIAAMFRVPLPLIGVMENAGYKITDAQRIFDTKTMRPLLDRLQNAISRGVTSAWGVDFVIDHEYIMPVEDRIRLTGEFAGIPGVRVREVREYAGLPPLGDERDDLVLNLPAEEGVEGDTRRGEPNRNLPGEAGRPPKGENVPAFPKPGEPLPPESRARRASEKAVKRAKPLAQVMAELDEMEGKAITAPSDDLIVQREADVDDIAAEMRAELVDAAHSLERSLLDHVEGKAAGQGIVTRIKRSQAWKTFTTRLTDILERAAVRALSTAAVHQGTQGNIPEEELDYEALAKRIVHRNEGVKSIVDNYRDGLIAKVAKAREEGTEIGDLEELVREHVQQWRDTQSETVALTEATIAYNEGTLSVVEALGTTRVYVTDGDEHDEPCKEANGQVWNIQTARERYLEHPRCRRAFIPLENEVD